MARGESPEAGPGTPCDGSMGSAVLHSEICECHHTHSKDWPAIVVIPAAGKEFLLMDLAGQPALAGLSPPVPTHLLARLG